MGPQTLTRMAGYAGLARDAWKLRRSDEEHVRAQVLRHLIERMGKLRGLPQKLGQMLSFSREADEAVAAEYAVLQEQVKPLPLETVRPLMETAWGRPLEDVLDQIEPRAHAASLGQVHRAVTRDGRAVAVKVQYPGIRQSVQSDLKMLGWLSVPVGNLRRGFDLGAYRQVILENLEWELDYRQEARSQHLFADWARSEPLLVVPEVVDQLSTDVVLVSEWEDGEPWNVVRGDWPKEERRQLASGMLRLMLDGLFRRLLVHGDWHPGNLRFRRDSGEVQLLLYDFGCVYRPTGDERLALLRLIRATERRDESPWPLMLKLGFDRQYLEPLADKLPALYRVLFEPFWVEYPYDLTHWRLGDRVSDILGDDRWNFRIAGPLAMIFLLRAFHGLIYYLEGLGTPIMWNRIFRPVQAALSEATDRLELPEPDVKKCDFQSMARYLKTRVSEGGRTKVELTQYASAIDNLNDFLEDDLKERIERQGIRLESIVRDVRRRGYQPGPVFELNDRAKHIEVRLE